MPAAIALSRALTERFPDAPQVWAGELHLLLNGAPPDEAEQRAREALARFPSDPAVLEPAARIADAGGDWPEALKRWSALCDRAPNSLANQLGLAIALRELGRPDEADIVLRNATTRVPGTIELVIERANLAERRHDWTAAEAFWRVCLALDPNHAGSRSGIATALQRQGRAAEPASPDMRQPAPPAEGAQTVAQKPPVSNGAMQTDVGLPAIVTAPDSHQQPVASGAATAGPQPRPHSDIPSLLRDAELTDARKDPAVAERRWQAVRSHAPDELRAWIGCAEAMRLLRRFDDCAALLDEATNRFGSEPLLLREYAWLADTLQDWAVAADRWRAFIAVDSRDWVAFYGLGKALMRLGRFSEADTVLLEQQAARPTEIIYFVVHAEFAENRADWELALNRWQAVRADFPDRHEGYEGVARALRELRRPDLAASVLAEAANRFPDAAGILLETARLARDSGRNDEALLVWKQIRQQFPHILSAYVDAEKVLREARRFDEAHEVLTEAFRLFPNEWVVWRQIGILAEARDDWAGAVAHWRAMGQRFPGRESESGRLHQAMLRLADADPAAADSASRLADGDGGSFSAGGDEKASLKEMAYSFESLGGSGTSGGCEFGIFQRDCGDEHLGLFRWASVLPKNLIACLNGRFEGMGDAGTIEVYLDGIETPPLWHIRDKRYGTEMHSFVPASDVPKDRMTASAEKRMRYLKDKLIADLEEGTKTFVLKLSERQLTQDEAVAIGQGIRSYGPGQFLCVCPADREHPEGTIDVRAPGVSVGYIDFSVPNGQDARKSAWLALCSKVAGTAVNAP